MGNHLDISNMPLTPQSTYARFAKFYDAYTAGYDEDIPFYLDAVAGCKSPLLEVGCGSGRIMLPLLRAGYDVTGVDISSEMIELARRKLNQESFGKTGELLLHDFAKGPLPGTVPIFTSAKMGLSPIAQTKQYGAALITFFTFNYIHPNERLAFLENIRRNLVDGAPVVLHLLYPAVLARPELDGKWQAKGCYQIDGEEVRLYDCRRMLNEYTEERCQRYEMQSGTSEEIKMVRYYLSPFEMAELLKTVGFTDLRFGEYLQYEKIKSLDEINIADVEYVVIAK
jgi:SAM-dependent methyltransferase